MESRLGSTKSVITHSISDPLYLFDIAGGPGKTRTFGQLIKRQSRGFGNILKPLNYLIFLEAGVERIERK